MTTQAMMTHKKQRHLPGEEGIWVFIVGDLLAFSLLFITFAYYRSLSPELYANSRLELNLHYGAINTLILLFSSWFVVQGCSAFRDGLRLQAKRHFCIAWLFGAAFGVVKVLEYREKISSGITPLSNDFFMYYFILTGIHFFHLIIGMAVLAWMISRCQPHTYRPDGIGGVEGGGAYWHMVDLLWVVIFPLLYMIA